ncbi:50S ribosomal protein L29 [Acetobacteroides hydrogenigenes]|uniref:Large ribosomal subunit protein uL29 n=1 Tax=Acetobacteroides hydrogenigenes TaxID=979970 RepID=A0A4R2EWL3_9BACT|nr:50S ribosomal protein L29 [Acetobacteroides hydrogenigenes]TCN73086.1 large subunit ribosomal protein L29 [Acetobacteroides hydrogenigenes]
MKANEVREMSSKDILERIATEKGELVKMKINHTVSPLDNPMLIKKSRRNVARLLTILAQKEQNK